jgi:DNA-binding transcriptional ArsR family regulator
MSLNAGLLPHRPPVDEPAGETRVVGLDTDAAADLCRSLASETATDILATLSAEPTTASQVADEVDTSLQNAHYHLERLQEAGLVEVVDTWYSTRGAEMDVYAAVYDEFVIVPSAEAATDREGTAGADRPVPGAPTDATGGDADADGADEADGSAHDRATGESSRDAESRAITGRHSP